MAWKELNLDCNKSSLKTIINISENGRYEIMQCTTSSRTRALQQYVDRVYVKKVILAYNYKISKFTDI